MLSRALARSPRAGARVRDWDPSAHVSERCAARAT